MDVARLCRLALEKHKGSGGFTVGGKGCGTFWMAGKAIDDGFYRKQFRFLDPELLENQGALERASRDSNVTFLSAQALRRLIPSRSPLTDDERNQ